VITLIVGSNTPTYTCVVIILRAQWSESHSPLHMSILIEWKWDGCGIPTASVSETYGMLTVCCRSEESNTVLVKHTQKIGTKSQRWTISTAPILWPRHVHRKWYSNIADLEHFGVNTTCQACYSMTWCTNNKVQHSHEGPALPLPKINCILSLFETLSPTQISSICGTIVSKLDTQAMAPTYLLSEC